MKHLWLASLLLAASTAVDAQSARVNIGHLAPFASDVAATAVSIEVDGAEVASGLVFDAFTGYLPVDAGNRQVDVFAPPKGIEPPPAIAGPFELIADTDYTVLAIGDGANQPLALLPLVDDNSAPAAGNVKLRVVHAAPFASELADTAVSIRTDAGDVVNGLSSVEFGQDSGFFELPADTYDLRVASPDGTATFIDLAPVPLADGTIVTIFAVGDGTNQPLGATAFFSDGTFASLDLESEARVNVGHLAPFDASIAATAVSVDVNGTEVLTGVTFDQFSGYLTVEAGSTQVDVFAPPKGMAPMPAISGLVDLAAGTDYTVLAIGDGANQPLALLPLVDDNSAPAAGNVKLRVVHAAPFASELADTAVSIRTDAGDVVNGLSNVEFAQDSGFFELPAGTYDLQVASPDGADTFINLAPVALAEGTIVTVFAVGDGTNQPLGATAFFSDGTFASLDLEPELLFADGFEITSINVAHLAPFAADVLDTAVSVDVNAMEALPNVVFNQFSGYVPFPSGDQLVEVFAPPGAMMAAISRALTVDANVRYSLVAIGDGVNQALALLALVDDDTAPAAGNVKLRIVHAAPFADSLPATAVSIRTDAGDVVNGLSDVRFAQDSGFFELPAGTYDLQVATPDGAQALIDLAPIELPDGTIVTVYAIGDGTNQPLGASGFFADGTAASLDLE